MTKRRSDALQALVREVADVVADIARARTEEELARTEFVAARQALDLQREARSALEEREAATRRALEIIQIRDGIADETVEALIARERSS